MECMIGNILKKNTDLKEHNTVSSYIICVIALINKMLSRGQMCQGMLQEIIWVISHVLLFLQYFSDDAEYFEEENIGLYVNNW